MTVRARAKVNLGLEVLGRRADGYHELRSLLWAIDLADWVSLEVSPEGIAVECDAAGIPSGRDNLAWRAADLVQRETGILAGVRIRIHKAIPAAAGLGGGSADAAAVLVGLGPLWGIRPPRAQLQTFATALGMDVPFFLGHGPALAVGRGERLRPVPGVRTAPPVPLVVVNPGFPLATREVYGALGPADFSDGTRVTALVAAVRRGRLALGPRVFNGLEGPVARLWPGLAEVKAALCDAGALAAVMSGSGPTVVGIARSRAAAARIQEALGRQPWRTWVTHTVTGPALSVVDERVPTGQDGSAARRRWGVAKR